MSQGLARRAGVVALGTASGQAAILAATPWLARIFSPADFGALALLMTVSNIAMAAGCLRYDLSLPAAPGAQSLPLLWVSLLAAALTAALTGVGAAIAAAAHNDLPPPFSVPALVTLCVVLVGWHQAALAWATRQQRYGAVGAIRLVQGAGFVVLALLSPLGLLWSHALSFAAALPVLLRNLHRKSWADIWGASVAQRQFPLRSLPGALLDVVGYSVCVWIIVGAYGVREAGQYSQVQRLVGAPLMLLAMSVGQVLLGHTASLTDNRQELQDVCNRVFRVLVAVSLAVIGLMTLAGEQLLLALLGPQWRVDAAFVVPITCAVAVRACVSPLTSVLVTLRRFDLALRWQLAYFVSALVVFSLAATNLSIGHFVFVYATHELLFYTFYLRLVRVAIKTPCAAFSA